ncbi:hypothetical protein FQN54_000646 [Arachnomyces sp. PD_36]|nr:hypothetical protein FQN54_000646 [Arachnomyces sp. PD_36]
MAKKARQTKQQKAQSQGDSENLQSSVAGPSNLFKEMNISMKKRRDKKRQELRRQHKLQTKKAEESIRDTYRVNKSAFDEHRSSKMKRLSELIRRRNEVEVKIISLLQTARDRYEAASGGLDAALEKGVANLR